ncbi:MAG: thiamine phosphate synthase, partial [Sphingomonadaceae bacterium]
TYGPPRKQTHGLIHMATVHNLAEIGQANRTGANAAFLSPVYPTRSHPEAKPLGPVRFSLLARYCQMPVIALGGMTAHRAGHVSAFGWAAIDGHVLNED